MSILKIATGVEQTYRLTCLHQLYQIPASKLELLVDNFSEGASSLKHNAGQSDCRVRVYKISLTI